MVQYSSSCSQFCLVTQRSSSFVGESVTWRDKTRLRGRLAQHGVTRRFNSYFINNNNKKKKKKEKKKQKIDIIIIIIININIDNDNNNNSNEDLDSLPMTEPQYRFWNSVHVVIRKLIHYALEKLLQFALKDYYILRQYYYILRRLLHFAA